MIRGVSICLLSVCLLCRRCRPASVPGGGCWLVPSLCPQFVVQLAGKLFPTASPENVFPCLANCHAGFDSACECDRDQVVLFCRAHFCPFLSFPSRSSLPRHAPIVPLSEHQSTALQKKIQNRRNPRRKRLPRRESLGHTAGTFTLQPANLSRVDYPRAADLDSGQTPRTCLLADVAHRAAVDFCGLAARQILAAVNQ